MIAMDVSTLGNTGKDLSVEIDDERDDEEMEVEDGDTKGSEFKHKIMDVLKQGAFEEKRWVDIIYIEDLTSQEESQMSSVVLVSIHRQRCLKKRR
ncbi:hypothetical protein LOK49_LG03G03294 [Camellia lanceoleosa]|uniref:Uncharacterized protein n=1 Tax=Camellia lanceoleosa TaxID=1840588 RepID=A0ACC0IF43_9ERIC|nr:hypothetical protein LOK49_LG03G03294 [Camellia lanceoleosa]